jgi:hypothetical protein
MMDGPAWGTAVVAGLVAVLALWGGFGLLWRSRRIEDMPLSLIRSAAQGMVELEGRVRAMPGPAIVAPLSGVDCVWWRMEVHCRDDRDRWNLVERGTSDDVFFLGDVTGDCIVDPVGAEVVPSGTRRWHGHWPRPGQAPQPGLDTFLSSGSYRYHEQILASGATVYAQGWFRTQTAEHDLDESREVASELAAWKKNPDELLRRFDANHDGRIDPAEWEAARAAATAAVRQRLVERAADPDLNVLCRPPYGAKYLISALPRPALARRYRLLGWACLALAALAAAVLLRLLDRHGLL